MTVIELAPNELNRPHVVLPNVAFIGAAGSGKTTAANVLVEQFGYTKLSFAEPLKVMLDTTTDRARLQEFGTDVVRAYEPDAWVRLFIWQMKLRGLDSPGMRVTVDDVRFRNEVEALQGLGFVIVRMHAPKYVRIDRLKRIGKLQDEAQLNHRSERELVGFMPNYVINNPEFNDRLAEDLAAVLNAERR